MRWTLVVAIILALYLGYTLRDTFDPESIKGKRVVVTGASTGIGEQMAYHYARLGAKLLVTSRREQRLQEVVAKCREYGDKGGKYYYHAADMSDMAATQKLIQVALEKLGGLDYLVLNHILVVPLGEWTGHPDNFTLLQRTLDVNLRAYVHLTSHALPALERSSGSVVVVSSIAGKIGQPYVSAYSASKFALDGFYSGLRQEMLLKQKDISITLCIIGFIGTENAVQKLKDFGVSMLFKLFPPADPADAALAIIKGGASRAREMYYPYMEAKLTTLFRDWFPDLLAALVRFMYGKE